MSGRLMGLLAAWMCWWPLAAAQAEPVRLVVPFPRGGAMDDIARAVAPALGAQLGRTTHVENRPGANGLIGTETAAKSKPDGSALLLGSPLTHVVNALAFGPIRYDPARDFAPVALLGELPMTLLVRASAQAATADAFLRGSKSYGSAGFASAGHVAMESVLQAQKLSVRHTPFPGLAQAVDAVLAGTMDAAIMNRGAAQPLPSPGVRALPLKTQAAFWVGVFVPSATPDAAVARLNAALHAAIVQPHVRDALGALGFEPAAGVEPAARFARYLAAANAQWSRAVREAAIQVELK